MHVLGLRLSTPEYKILFDEHDIDGSGTIDLEEFTHMIKKYLRLPCAEEDCVPCTMTEDSNQPHTVYRRNWADDETRLKPAASVIQKHVRSALIREETGFLAVARMNSGDGEVESVEAEKARTNMLEKMGQMQESEQRRSEERDEARKRQEEKLREREARMRKREARSAGAEKWEGVRFKNELGEGLEPDWKLEEREEEGEEREASVANATNTHSDAKQEQEFDLVESIETKSEQQSKDPRQDHLGGSTLWAGGVAHDDFSRLASARDGAMEQFLSFEEAQRARHTTDDVVDKNLNRRFDKLRPKTHEVATRKNLQDCNLWGDPQLNNAKQRHVSGWQGLNQNLNHDNDESIFRGGTT